MSDTIPLPPDSRWTILEIKHDHWGRKVAQCVCVCGTKGKPLLYNVKKGTSKSCGCLRRERRTT